MWSSKEERQMFLVDTDKLNRGRTERTIEGGVHFKLMSVTVLHHHGLVTTVVVPLCCFLLLQSSRM